MHCLEFENNHEPATECLGDSRYQQPDKLQGQVVLQQGKNLEYGELGESSSQQDSRVASKYFGSSEEDEVFGFFVLSHLWMRGYFRLG